jgi:hypothetical protein
LSVGNLDTGDAKTDETTFSVAAISAIMNAGTDQPPIISFNASVEGLAVKVVGANNALTNLFSKGRKVFFDFVNADRIDGVAGGRTVFTWTTVKDKDGDFNAYNSTNDIFDDFKIKVDGTGANNDPNNVAPTGFGTSYDTVTTTALVQSATLASPDLMIHNNTTYDYFFV